MTSIKQKAINGMAWSVSERISLQVMQMIISIVLARLLEPAEFGLIGMLAIFTSIAQSLIDSGFGSALIQKKNATQTDSSSIFYFNLVFSVILASILFFSAPLIADFYDQPDLLPITRVLSLGLVINASSIVQVCILRRNLDFKKHFIANITSVIISGIGGIVAALAGLGVWSLVIQSLANSLIKAIILWTLKIWRPIVQISIASLKTMFSFGSKLLLAGLMETVFTNLYQTFIGRQFTASDLGYYSRASTMESAASISTSMALGQVIFPALSPYQDDKIKLKQAHSKTIKMSMFLHIPLMTGLIFIAEPLLLFLLTDKWAESIPYFQLLCIIGMIYPIQVQNYNLFRITGRSDIILKFGVVKYLLTAIAIALTYKHGILALIYGQITVAVLSQLIASYIAGNLINYPLFEQIKELFPSMALSIVMGAIVFFAGKINTESNLIIFSVQICVGILSYYLLNKLIKSPELAEFITIIQGLLGNFLHKVKGILWKNR